MAEITINQEYIVKINATIETDLTNEEIENLIPTIPEVFKEMIIEEITGGVGTVDVQPVKHGHWIVTEYYNPSEFDEEKAYTFKCSECGNAYHSTMGMSYCMDCGAKMDGEQE